MSAVPRRWVSAARALLVVAAIGWARGAPAQADSEPISADDFLAIVESAVGRFQSFQVTF